MIAFCRARRATEEEVVTVAEGWAREISPETALISAALAADT